MTKNWGIYFSHPIYSTPHTTWQFSSGLCWKDMIKVDASNFRITNYLDHLLTAVGKTFPLTGEFGLLIEKDSTNNFFFLSSSPNRHRGHSEGGRNRNRDPWTTQDIEFSEFTVPFLSVIEGLPASCRPLMHWLHYWTRHQPDTGCSDAQLLRRAEIKQTLLSWNRSQHIMEMLPANVDPTHNESGGKWSASTSCWRKSLGTRGLK